MGEEAENIVERVLQRLNHNNPAVVLSAVKVILKALDKFTDEEVRKATVKKMSGPLVTLLSCEAELQYIALERHLYIKFMSSH